MIKSLFDCCLIENLNIAKYRLGSPSFKDLGNINLLYHCLIGNKI